MNSAVADEIISINCIYDITALELLSEVPLICALRLPIHQSISVRVEFPPNYPDSSPSVLGTQTSGDESTKKGESTRVVETVRETLAKVFRSGEPCIFDLVEEILELVKQEEVESDGSLVTDEDEDPGSWGLTDPPAKKSSKNAPAGPAAEMFNALIRTHHITSRKKVAKLKQAANACSCYVLLRSGGSPGIMYVEGQEDGVKQWVSAVQRLRYKDYQLVAKPAALEERDSKSIEKLTDVGFEEVAAVKEFGLQMESRGVLPWWRRAMGYIH